MQGDGNIISSGRALGAALNASTLDAAMLRKLSQQPPQGSRLSAMLTQGGESLMVRIKAALSTAPHFRTPSQVRVRLPLSPCHSPIASARLCLPLLASSYLCVPLIAYLDVCSRWRPPDAAHAPDRSSN